MIPMEEWKTIIGFPNYKISNMGNVMNVKYNRPLIPFDRAKYSSKNKHGYRTVHMPTGLEKPKVYNKYVHSLVMESFVGPRPKGYVINHINGIPWDNRLENLEYCTISHNRKEDFIHGRDSLRGENNTQAKLNESQVLEILVLLDGIPVEELAKMYGVHRSGIYNIKYGHCWSYLTGIKQKT